MLLCSQFLNLSVLAQHQLYWRKRVLFFKCLPSSLGIVPLTPTPPLLTCQLECEVSSLSGPTWTETTSLLPCKFYWVPSQFLFVGWPNQWVTGGYTFPEQFEIAIWCGNSHFVLYFFRWLWIYSRHEIPPYFPENLGEIFLSLRKGLAPNAYHYTLVSRTTL